MKERVQVKNAPPIRINKTEIILYFEIPFDLEFHRYVYRYDPKTKPAEEITYFFTIILKNGAIHAVPINQTGELKPINQKLVDPVEYYKQRAAYKN